MEEIFWTCKKLRESSSEIKRESSWHNGVGRRQPQYALPRPASDDMIYIIHTQSHMDQSLTRCPCWLSVLSTANQSGPVTLTFDLESGLWVMSDTGYLIANFSFPRPLFSTLARCTRQTDRQTDRQTSDRQTSDAHHRLMPPWRGTVIMSLYLMYDNRYN